MAKEIRSFKNLLGKLDGISDPQLEAHFGLYEGYVKKLNEIEEKLEKTDKSLSNYSFGEYAELKRRYSVPYMGSYLHEMYFDNLIAKGAPSVKFEELAKSSFGSFDNWKTDVKATGLAVPGWVMTCYETTTGKLKNLQIMEHHVGFLVNHVPVLVLDTWEHAFFLDHKANRGAYIDVFFKNINWDVVNERLAKV
ncbi:MAG: superoxide dismutase [Bdellovibrionota bacterium]